MRIPAASPWRNGTVATNEAGTASLTFQTEDSGSYLLQTTLEDSQGSRWKAPTNFSPTARVNGILFKSIPVHHSGQKRVCPGETASLLIASDYPNAHVWTFLRNSWKNESRRLVALDRQTAWWNAP